MFLIFSIVEKRAEKKTKNVCGQAKMDKSSVINGTS